MSAASTHAALLSVADCAGIRTVCAVGATHRGVATGFRDHATCRFRAGRERSRRVLRLVEEGS